MDVDIRGRVANVKLSRSRCLLPLFEAIMNSLHSIEESETKDGRIEIRIERDESQKTLVASDSASFPVSGFTIIDNGIGFTRHHAFSHLLCQSLLHRTMNWNTWQSTKSHPTNSAGSTKRHSVMLACVNVKTCNVSFAVRSKLCPQTR